MSKKGGAVLQKDAPWRAPSTGVKPLPKIHHSPVLCIAQNPYTDYAVSLMKVRLDFVSVCLNLVNYECVSSIYFHRTGVFLYLNEKLKFRKSILKTFFAERGLGDCSCNLFINCVCIIYCGFAFIF